VPLPFIRSSGYACVDAVVDAGAGNWDVYTIGTATEVLCFSALPSISPAEPWGMQILGPTGAVAFDTSRKPLGVAWITNVAGVASGYAGAAFTIPALSQPAYFLPSNGINRVQQWGSFSDTYTESVLSAQISGTSLQLNYLGIFISTVSHAFEPDPLAPDVLEDVMAPTIVAVIEGSYY
jgi:hypothetical protein